MIRNRTRRAALLGVVAASSLFIGACSSDDATEDVKDATSEAKDAAGDATDTAKDAADDAAGSTGSYEISGREGNLVGEGASSQQKAMEYFKVAYSSDVPGATMDYTASGSGAGQKNFIAGNVAFGGSDSPLSEDQIEPAAERCGGNEAWHLPMVIGPVAVAYHLDGIDDLTLSPMVTAQIFKGEITKWNDDAIAELNEGVDLPDEDIQVFYRSEESGTSDNFQKFLEASTDGYWKNETKKAFPQDVGSGTKGSTGVVTETNATEGSITYVEAGFTKDYDDVKNARLDFGNGPVELNPESVGKALDNLTYKTEGHNMVVDSKALFAMKEDGAYPLVLTTYELVCSAGYDEETRDLVKDFLTVALNHQDEQLAEQGYIPVSGEYAEKLRAAVDAIQ